MRIRYHRPLGIVLFALLTAACEDDPTDLDYLKDAGTSAPSAAGASGSAGAAGAAGSTSTAAGSGGASGAAGE
jgi:hypothetical protein